ncbi:hypothetical protein BO86DRAFT_105552 [Aspergillus japonicus CBS 114.51]|uniref:Uncharacterized protein n=1 Tax=Aspergillus japonicus CBS 114.51 TaxID=1448312 RepID=A0A8T8WZF1_ASPJA|nr:hypothetical protein BO86DRAFT_105552 [Aspergillus japonicus CBS 114.51]RAH81044.1 hypothetical protein BO86DRAFT_105552 [Aspergillus japonicus CBS 114.51]
MVYFGSTRLDHYPSTPRQQHYHQRFRALSSVGFLCAITYGLTGLMFPALLQRATTSLRRPCP